MSIHDDLKTVEEDLARGAQVAGEFMLDLVRRARAELASLVGDEPAPVEAPAPESPAPAAPTPEVAVADAEPLVDLHGEPVAELPPKLDAPKAGEA